MSFDLIPESTQVGIFSETNFTWLVIVSILENIAPSIMLSMPSITTNSGAPITRSVSMALSEEIDKAINEGKIKRLIDLYKKYENDLFGTPTKCAWCSGSGEYRTSLGQLERCYHCDGTGIIKNRGKISVTVKRFEELSSFFRLCGGANVY